MLTRLPRLAWGLQRSRDSYPGECSAALQGRGCAIVATRAESATIETLELLEELELCQASGVLTLGRSVWG